MFHVSYGYLLHKSPVCGPGGEKCQFSTVSRGFRAVTKLCFDLNPHSLSSGQGGRLRGAKSEGGIYDDGAREMRVDTINSTVTGGDKPVCIISLGARPVFTLFKLWPSADMYVSEV